MYSSIIFKQYLFEILDLHKIERVCYTQKGETSSEEKKRPEGLPCGNTVNRTIMSAASSGVKTPELKLNSVLTNPGQTLSHN